MERALALNLIGVEEFVRNLTTADWKSTNLVSNVATAMIGGRVHRYITHDQPDRFLVDDEHGQRVLKMAMTRLEQMDFVGLSEHLDDSLYALTEWLGLPSLNVTCHANRIRQTHAIREEYSLSVEVVELIERHNSLDMELYALARRLYTARWQAMGLRSNPIDCRNNRCKPRAGKSSGKTPPMECTAACYQQPYLQHNQSL